MKKFFWLALLICFLAVFSFANEKKTGFYLKIYGSPIFSNGGDFNDMIDSNSDYLLNEGKSFSGTYDISVKHSPFFYGFGGEIGYDFGKFSIGIETGYELKNFKMNRTWFDGYKGKWYCTLSTIPILLNMNFKVINSPSIQACLIGGGGIHFGKYEENWNFRNISNKNLLYIVTEKSKEQQFVFFGGI